MKERIDITVNETALAANPQRKQRLAGVDRFETTDRVPVIAGPDFLYLLNARGSSFATYIRSARDNLREQILNQKWRFENIPDDAAFPEEGITVFPDMGSLRASEFDMQIRWFEGDCPKCVHPLTSPEQIDSLQVPPPDNALNGQLIQWYRQMRDAAEDFDVRLNGRPIPIRVILKHCGGPIPAAFALGGENLLLWMATDPQRIHRLMDIVTESFIRCTRHHNDLCGRGDGFTAWLGCDAAELISPDMFREFVVPYYLRVWEIWPGRRTFHMCGKIDHLLGIIRDELRIDFLDGFGFGVEPQCLAETMAGKAVLAGGPHPMLIHSGSPQDIRDACSQYIRIVGRHGGYILTPGGGLPVGTPPAHVAAMVEASGRCSG